MIDTINIENVQAIEKLELPLGKVTAIVGNSDAGKSSLVRGLLAMLTNSFKSSLLRVGKSSLKVSIVIDGCEVGFYKGAKSKYFCGTHEFTKVGKEVPEMVVKTVGLDYITFDKGLRFFLPIQDQLQKQFLVDDYGGIASKVIGRLSNLGIVYVARRKAIAAIKANNSEKSSVEETVRILKQNFESISAISSEEALSNIEVKLEEAEFVEGILEHINKVVGFAEKREELEVINKVIKIISVKIAEADELVNNLAIIEDAEKQVVKFQALQSQVGFNTEAVSEKIVEVEKLGRWLELLESFIVTTEHNNKIAIDIGENEIAIKQTNLELDTLIDSMGVCPTCNKPLDAEAKKVLSE